MRLLILFTNVLVAGAIWAIPEDADRMRSAIRIQEKIIDAVVETDTSFSLDGNTDGIYIEGLGAVFTVGIEYEGDHSFDFGIGPGPRPEFPEVPRAEGMVREFHTKLEEAEKQVAEAEIMVRKLRSQRKDRTNQAAEYVAQVEGMIKALKDYLADYGPAMSIPEGETILLRAVFQGDHGFGGRARTFKLMAAGKDLNALRSGELSREAFLQERVKQEEGDGVTMDIDVMRNILDTAFEPRRYGESWVFWMNAPRSWATYIPGFGALFFHRYADFSFRATIELPRITREKVVVKAEKDVVSESVSGDEDRLTRLERNLVKLMATYAPTVKSLQPTEQLAVAVKLSTKIGKGKDTMLILQLQKSDINAYHDNPDELKEKVAVTRL